MIASSNVKPRPEGTAGRDFISWSQLSTFRQCPLRYQFRYLDKLEPEFIASSLLFGSSIHSAIEYHHRKQLECSASATIDEMLEAFWHEWKSRAEDSPEIRFGSKDDINSVGVLADSMLSAFLKHECSEINGAVIGIEESVTGVPLSSKPKFLGILDLMFLRNDRLVIRDYKTSRSRWNQAMAEGASGQLGLYCELAKSLLPGIQVDVEFVVITKTKSPTIENFPATVNQRQLQRTLTIAERTLEAISKGIFYPNRSQMNCHSCPYRAACLAWRG